jgi:hypothetical protein
LGERRRRIGSESLFDVADELLPEGEPRAAGNPGASEDHQSISRDRLSECGRERGPEAEHAEVREGDVTDFSRVVLVHAASVAHPRSAHPAGMIVSPVG